MTEPQTIGTYLASRPYPGRGLVLGRSQDGAVTVLNFLTGRSPASQARKMVLTPGMLEVVPTNGAADDPLRHYSGIIAKGAQLVAGNGRHVSEVAESGGGPATADDVIRRQTYEPDPPLFTPRLTAVVNLQGDPVALLGIAFRGARGKTEHRLQRVHELVPGEVWLMHTYDGNIDTPTSDGFIAHLHGGDTEKIGLQEVWDALSPHYRVAIGSVTIGSESNWEKGEWSVKDKSTGATSRHLASSG